MRGKRRPINLDLGDSRERWKAFASQNVQLGAMIARLASMSDSEIEAIANEQTDDLLHQAAKKMQSERLKLKKKQREKERISIPKQKEQELIPKLPSLSVPELNHLSLHGETKAIRVAA